MLNDPVLCLSQAHKATNLPRQKDTLFKAHSSFTGHKQYQNIFSADKKIHHTVVRIQVHAYVSSIQWIKNTYPH